MAAFRVAAATDFRESRIADGASSGLAGESSIPILGLKKENVSKWSGGCPSEIYGTNSLGEGK